MWSLYVSSPHLDACFHSNKPILVSICGATRLRVTTQGHKDRIYKEIPPLCFTQLDLPHQLYVPRQPLQ